MTKPMLERLDRSQKPTALLVLADGTVLEGFGLGAEGTRRGRGLLQHGDDRL